MKKTVYVDQNVLSDLRLRKLEDGQNLVGRRLYGLLMSRTEQLRMVYSHVHLGEIVQIGNEAFQEEHIDLLCGLKALYLAPGSGGAEDMTARQVWNDYKRTCVDNDRLGITDVVAASDKLQRLVSGLPSDETSVVVRDRLAQALEAMLGRADDSLEELASNATMPMAEIERIKFLLRDLHERTSKFLGDPFTQPPQGVHRSFRDLDEIKKLRLESLDAKAVIPVLEAAFNGAFASFGWDKYVPDTIESRVARCYTLMNWAGYYADDFARHKKGQDRFRASMNDVQHAQNALRASYLVSNDAAFLRKAEACYLHLGVGTRVLTVEALLDHFTAP